MPQNPYQPPKEVGKRQSSRSHLLLRILGVCVWIASTLALAIICLILVAAARDLSLNSLLIGFVLLVLPATGGAFLGCAAWFQRIWCLVVGILLFSPIALLIIYQELLQGWIDR
jgi:hypothetical protein